VTQINGTRLSLIDTLIDEFRTLEYKAPPYLVTTHGKQLNSFNQIVTEPVIETALYGLVFVGFTLWE
jgi:hypothetical protein